ncbi:MAG: ABC transporter ATP-binding protein [Anaerolineaceae bacterium]|nr:ABC transporter ATP-binding protein [Anaerolineaceae bacterium]
MASKIKQENSKQTPALSLKNVVKNYKTEAGLFPALKSISLDIYAGEFTGIFGKSGAGKSTLVNMITGVDHITEGEIWVGDIPIHKKSQDELACWRGTNVGVVYQSFELLPQLSLIDNVMLPMDFCGKYFPGESPKRALELLEQVEIAEHAYKSPNLISGGQQQRVAIARALANDPDIIVGDEPTGNLDSVTSETILKLFENLVAQGKTVIMVSHDPTYAARMDHVIQIVDGEVVENFRKEGKKANVRK